MFGTKRLKKKAQSIDITAAGFDPLAPGTPHTLQPSKQTPVISTSRSEEEQNNTTNTQRRNPRRGELKRYYTIDLDARKDWIMASKLKMIADKTKALFADRGVGRQSIRSLYSV